MHGCAHVCVCGYMCVCIGMCVGYEDSVDVCALRG